MSFPGGGANVHTTHQGLGTILDTFGLGTLQFVNGVGGTCNASCLLNEIIIDVKDNCGSSKQKERRTHNCSVVCKVSDCLVACTLKVR